MTLEQLKHRQEDLNQQLREITSTTGDLISRVTGEYREPEAEMKESLYPDEGIIGGIALQQQYTQNIIADLRKAMYRLQDHVSHPQETCTDVVGRQIQN